MPCCLWLAARAPSPAHTASVPHPPHTPCFAHSPRTLLTRLFDCPPFTSPPHLAHRIAPSACTMSPKGFRSASSRSTASESCRPTRPYKRSGFHRQGRMITHPARMHAAPPSSRQCGPQVALTLSCLPACMQPPPPAGNADRKWHSPSHACLQPPPAAGDADGVRRDAVRRTGRHHTLGFKGRWSMCRNIAASSGTQSGGEGRTPSPRSPGGPVLHRSYALLPEWPLCEFLQQNRE